MGGVCRERIDLNDLYWVLRLKWCEIVLGYTAQGRYVEKAQLFKGHALRASIVAVHPFSSRNGILLLEGVVYCVTMCNIFEGMQRKKEVWRRGMGCRSIGLSIGDIFVESLV